MFNLTVLTFAVSMTIIWPAVAHSYDFLHFNPQTQQPLRWDSSKPIEYWVEGGDCAHFSNEEMVEVVDEMADLWNRVVSIELIRGGTLAGNIFSGNFWDYEYYGTCFVDDGCSEPFLREAPNLIIFDEENGALLNASNADPSQALAITHIEKIGGTLLNPVSFERVSIIIHCEPFNELFTLDDLRHTILHEFGHFLGLSHTPVTLEDLGAVSFSPVLGADAFNLTLLPDDLAGIGVLYDLRDNTFSGTIRGTVRQPDGKEVRDAVVIARGVEDPFCEVYTHISGRGCMGNFVDRSPCNDEELYGDYEIRNLPPGTYVLSLADIADRTSDPYLAGESLPGEAEFWNEGDSEKDDPYEYTTIKIDPHAIIEGIDFVTSSNSASASQPNFIPINIIKSLFDRGPGTKCPATEGDADGGGESPVGDIGSEPGSSPIGSSSGGGCNLIMNEGARIKEGPNEH